jgi:hypothetical protein
MQMPEFLMISRQNNNCKNGAKMKITAKQWMLMISLGLYSGLSMAAVCNSQINNNAVGGLSVPANATCIINGTAVDGNVNVQKGGSLVLHNSSVSGSIQADAAMNKYLLGLDHV